LPGNIRLIKNALLFLLFLKIALGILILPFGFKIWIFPGDEKSGMSPHVGSFQFPGKDFTFRETRIKAAPFFLNDKTVFQKEDYIRFPREQFPFLLVAQGKIRVKSHDDSLFLVCDLPASVSLNGPPFTSLSENHLSESYPGKGRSCFLPFTAQARFCMTGASTRWDSKPWLGISCSGIY
jgi:hypothetical protein